MSELSIVWTQIEAFLSQNISIIPVRDKDADRPAKTPYAGWKKHQTEIIEKEELWKQMEKFNTSAIAIICGKVSGNLEVIDVDVKYKNGVDAILFTNIQTLYPDIFEKLRIHKTPSGGYHLIYKIADRIPEGNQKLAGRHATDDELRVNPKVKSYNFLETRGEGGYIVAPPSLGYSFHNFKDIPTLTWEERCSIIELCRQLSEVNKVIKEKPKSTTVDSHYVENPFDNYNKSAAAEDVLIDNGWQFYSKTSDYIYYTRPGKSKGISASFNKQQRLYYFFSSSTEFEVDTWYSPATVLAKLKFRDNKSDLYRWLVDNGYGIYKKKHEHDIILSAAISKKPLPANISKQSKEEYEKLVLELNEIYPVGVFWNKNEDGYSISRQKIYTVSEFLGFRIYNEQVCLIDGYRVKKVTERAYFDALLAYIKEEDAEEYEAIVNCFEAFLQKSGSFTVSRLPILDTDLFLKSNKTTSYKFYMNCYVSVTSDGMLIHDYSELNGLIWEDQIQNRYFSNSENDVIKSCLYYKYLHHAIGISKHLMQCIGYLAHEYKDEEGGYIIVLTEQCENPKDGGGSGKNIFTALFANTTTVKNIPGTQVQYNEKFLQAWNYERIFAIQDVPKRFDFTFLKEISTGSGILKKLWKDEEVISTSDMPKLIVSTNFSYEVSDGGLRRRIIPIEFTNFFTQAGGVGEYFGVMFPSGWTENDWLGYDNFIIACIQIYLQGNGKLKSQQLTDTGWIKQFEHEFGLLTHEFIKMNINRWKDKKKVKNEDFNRDYDNFCIENNVQKKFQISSIFMNRALEAYCNKFNIKFNHNVVFKENGISYRGRIFGYENIDNQQDSIDFTIVDNPF